MLQFTLVFLCALISGVSTARFELANVFGSGMVLQRDRPNNVWGWATPATSVYLTLSGPTGAHTFTALARAGDGLWVGVSPSLPAGGVYTLTLSSTPGVSNTSATWLQFSGIWMGDVILCSGQVRFYSLLACFSAPFPLFLHPLPPFFSPFSFLSTPLLNAEQRPDKHVFFHEQCQGGPF